MPTQAPFRVQVLGFSVLEELEGAWTEDDFRLLLERMDYGDVTGVDPGELRELCLLSLQDLEPAEAAKLLLRQRLGDALSAGQIQNAAHEMLDEKLWEEYADMPLHERLFHVGSLLYQAWPGVFPLPDAVRVELAVEAADAEGTSLLAAPLHESLIVRLLAHGMPASATLNRLFGDAVAGRSFPDAESIVWIVRTTPRREAAVSLEVVGSGYWLDALRTARSYESAARPDA